MIRYKVPDNTATTKKTFDRNSTKFITRFLPFDKSKSHESQLAPTKTDNNDTSLTK